MSLSYLLCDLKLLPLEFVLCFYLVDVLKLLLYFLLIMEDLLSELLYGDFELFVSFEIVVCFSFVELDLSIGRALLLDEHG